MELRTFDQLDHGEHTYHGHEEQTKWTKLKDKRKCVTKLMIINLNMWCYAVKLTNQTGKNCLLLIVSKSVVAYDGGIIDILIYCVLFWLSSWIFIGLLDATHCVLFTSRYTRGHGL